MKPPPSGSSSRPPDRHPPHGHNGYSGSNGFWGKPDPWMLAHEVRECLTFQRTEVLRHLARGALGVQDLADEIALDHSQISRYLAPMRRLNLVNYVDRGHEHMYFLTPQSSVHREGEWVVIRLLVSDACQLELRVHDPDFDLSPRLGHEPAPPGGHPPIRPSTSNPRNTRPDRPITPRDDPPSGSTPRARHAG